MIEILDYPERKPKYPNGYQPKIDYWQYKANKAINRLDVEGARFALDRLEYFINRQAEVEARMAQLYK
jgi:hypothetical protein